MQQLHLVGFTTDHDGLIFSARRGAKSGGYLVAIDDRLLTTLDEALREQADENGRAPRRVIPKPESALSPRAIQVRLRAGRSIAAVASEAGVDEEWVMRFAAPILAEQARVIEQARNMVFAKPRRGSSAHPLGMAVWWNAADRGVRMTDDDFDACWSAYHLRDSSWVVRFAYVNRAKRQHAEWEVDLREQALMSRNRLASDLGYIEPGRRGRPPAPLPGPNKPAAAPAKRVAGKKTATRATAAKRPPGKAAARKPAGRNPAAKKATPKKATPKKATNKARPPARKTTTRRPAPKKTPARRAPVRASAAKRAPAKKTARRATPRKATPRKAAARRPAPRQRPPAPSAAQAALPRGDSGAEVQIRADRAADALPDTAPVPVVSTPSARPAPAPPPAAARPAVTRRGLFRRR